MTERGAHNGFDSATETGPALSRRSVLTGDPKLGVEDAAASLSFERLAIVPLVLLVVFGFVWWRERGKSRAALAGEAA